MRAARRVLPIALTLVLSHVLTLPTGAQPRLVQLVNADSVAVDATTGETVRTLVGDVVLRQDTTTLRADRAVQRVEAGLVTLEGGVRIVTGRDTLTARRVVYDANTNEAVAEGDVRIANGESVLLAPRARHNRLTEVSTFDQGGRLLNDGAVLTAPRGTYDAQRELAVAEGGVELADSATVLTSASGRYDTRLERADFTGDVRLRQRGVRLDADSLTHFRETERSEAWGRVVLERLGGARDEADGGAAPDSTQRLLLFGARAEHDERAGTSRVVGTPALDPLLVQLRTDSTGATDTTLVRARRLDALRREGLPPPEVRPSPDSLAADSLAADSLAADSLAADSLAAPPAMGERIAWPPAAEEDDGTFTRVVGAGDVRLVRPRLAAVADSAAFERWEPADTLAAVEDRLALFGAGRPSVWFEDAQVAADTLVAFARDEALDRMEGLGDAFAAQLDTTLGRVRQLAGRRLLARFEGDSLRVLAVWPNAEAIHFRATPDGLLDGADRLSADSLTFLFREGELREIHGDRGIEGVSYGPQIIPEPFRLPGYVYTPEVRPAREALLPPDGWEAAWLDAHPRSGEEGPASAPEPPAAEPEEDTPTDQRSGAEEGEAMRSSAASHQAM